MQIATIVIPKFKKRKVWIGYYFNHYNAIVIYHTKPVKGTCEDNPDLYDTHDNKDKIAGCLTLEEFKELFPSIDLSHIMNKHGNVNEIETKDLTEVTLIAPWNRDRLYSIDFGFDGY